MGTFLVTLQLVVDALILVEFRPGSNELTEKAQRSSVLLLRHQKAGRVTNINGTSAEGGWSSVRLLSHQQIGHTITLSASKDVTAEASR